MTTADTERAARAALARLVEPGDAAVGAAVAAEGAVNVLSALRAGCSALPQPVRSAVQARLAAAGHAAGDPARELERAARLGCRLVCPGDDEWPSGLDVLADVRPLVMWLRGPLHLRRTCDGAVAVVGARAATAYGMHVAGELAAELADGGRAVVSGGAYGIDGSAHRGALAAGGQTVAVLACGVDVPYPRGHDALFGRIAGEGLLLSEWAPGSVPQRHRFLVRNRVIATATGGTVVIEAAVRSGALCTARLALAAGRPVMAVPGPVTSPMSAGCHQLLRDDPNVRLVTRAAEVVEEVGRLGDDLAPVLRSEATIVDALSPDARRVLDALPVRRGRGPARIAADAGLPVPVVLRCLPVLELDGLAERDAGGHRLGPSLRSRPAPSA